MKGYDKIRVVFILILSLSLLSCGVLHVEKRHFRKGYHISWNNNKNVESHKGSNDLEVDRSAQEIVSIKKDELIQVQAIYDNRIDDRTDLEPSNELPFPIKSDQVLFDDRPSEVGLGSKQMTKKIASKFVANPGTGQGVWMIVLGSLIFAVGLFFGGGVLILGGELLGVLILVGAGLGIILIILGIRRNKYGSRTSRGTGNRRGGTERNKWALTSFILLLVGVALIFIIPLAALLLLLSFIFSIIALIQIKKHHNRYSNKWMALTTFYIVIAAIVVFGSLVLLLATSGF